MWTAWRDRLGRGWDALLRRNTVEARPILRQLLVGRFTLTTRQLPDGRFYEFSATATYGALLSGVVAGLVPPVSPVEPDTDARVSFRAVWCAA
jgi:hypothetical protein